MKSQSAIVVGGGIGGLTAALCLIKAGWQVEVLEQAQGLSEVGAGLQISPNGMRVLSFLGLKALLEPCSFRPQALEMRLGYSGRRIFSIPVAEAAVRRWGETYLHIHRADLQDVLSAALEDRRPGALKLAVRVEGIDHSGDEARVRLASGETLTADLVVAADGIHSVIREQLTGPQPPRFTGNVAWRMVVPTDRLKGQVPPSTACVWVGPGRHAVTYRLRGGALANLVGVVERSDWQGESWLEEGTRQEARHDFRGFHPLIQGLIEAAESHGRWALFDRAPLMRWVQGRVALLGDACHPTLPFMAQGAVMAIEDAYVLAKTVSGTRSIEDGLLDYERMRLPRTSALQAAARKNMQLFHRKTLAGQILTYAPMWLGGRLFPEFVRGRQDWIYGYDVTRLNIPHRT